MYSMSIPALLAAALLSTPAQAQQAANSVPQKLQALKDANAALDSGIKNFLEAVDGCDLPAQVKTQIVDGFAGPANKDNALALLKLREEKVSAVVADSETKFGALGGGNILGANACKGGAAGFEATVAGPADTISKEAQDKIQAELALYQQGNVEASKKEPLLRGVLGLRARTASGAAGDSCKKALGMLGEPGKNNGLLKESDKTIQDGYAGLLAAYPARVASIRETGRVLVAAGKCSQPLRTAMFPSIGSPRDRSGEYQVSELSNGSPGDGNTAR